MNKAKRLVEQLPAESAAALCAALGDPDAQATPKQQAAYIDAMLNTADRMGICMKDSMRKCGGCCLTADIVEDAKALYAKADGMAEFLTLLNAADIGGGNLHLSDGKIIGTYQTCYCDIPWQVEKIHKGYCECSAGWYMGLFSAVLGKPVTVTLIDSIANGAAQCTFEISGVEV